MALGSLPERTILGSSIPGVDDELGSFIRVTIKQEDGPVWYAWALDDHYNHTRSSRTYVGELVYKAKYNTDRTALRELLNVLRHSIIQLRNMPMAQNQIRLATAVAAVPCNPSKPMSLPHEAARLVAATLGIRDISDQVVKVRSTPPAKLSPQSQVDAYGVHMPLRGHNVLLIDDLLHTGATLESVAVHLRNAGAATVVGMCLTKVQKGMSQ